MQLHASREFIRRKPEQEEDPSAGQWYPRQPQMAEHRGEPNNGNPLERAIVRVALERSRAGEALQILTGKLLQAQEEERKRIARELHDGLNQQLAVLAIELGILARQAAKEAPGFGEQLSNLRDLTEALSNDLRHVTHQLHPAVLEHLGLTSALQSHCAEFSQREGIHTWFTVEQDVGAVPPDIAISLYRITQEALRNVAKHSGAKEAWVKITTAQNGLQLSIVDNGVGFCRDAVQEKVGLGLVSIQERVQIVRGQLIIRSSPNEGTRIEIHVPILWKEQRSEHERKHGKTQAAAG
jgi:signal transduction histidine kinase